MGEIPYETLSRIIPANRVPTLKLRIGAKKPEAVTGTGIDDEAVLDYIAKWFKELSDSAASVPLGSFERQALGNLLKLRENLARYGTPEQLSGLDARVNWHFIGERFGDEIARKERDAAARNRPRRIVAADPDSRLADLIRQQAYTASELIRYGVINQAILSRLEDNGLGNQGSGSMPRIWWALNLAGINQFKSLLKFGFGIVKQEKVDLGSLDALLDGKASGAAILSEEEKGIIGTLEERDLAPLATIVTEFYQRGKPFLRYPLVTLLWIAARGTKAANLKLGSNREGYMANFANALPRYADTLLKNAQILRNNGTVPTTSPEATVEFLDGHLSLVNYAHGKRVL